VLDKLENVEGISFEDQYDIINARAAFYYYFEDYESALKDFKLLEKQMSDVKLKPRLSNVYYSISLIYSGLGQRDSSLLYAKKAVEHFPDSVSQWQDYNLYVNLGKAASRVRDYELAASRYKDAVDFLVEKSGESSEKKILELEKQYDLSQAKVETLRQKQKFQRFAFIAGAGFVLLVFIVLIYFLNLRKSRLELDNERLMRISAEKEVAGKIRESFQRRHLLRFYQLITQREMVAQQRFDMLSQKYIRTDSSAYNELQTELNALKEEFSGMMYNLMNDDLFYSNVDVPPGFPLSNTEKVVLFLLKFEIPSAEIATVLGITNNNLRVRKSNLKKRILEKLPDHPSLNDLLSLFN
jgi:tetratricopeptide (TPR) repeat protein